MYLTPTMINFRCCTKLIKRHLLVCKCVGFHENKKEYDYCSWKSLAIYILTCSVILLLPLFKLKDWQIYVLFLSVDLRSLLLGQSKSSCKDCYPIVLGHIPDRLID
jgi:hypothetical protein